MLKKFLALDILLIFMIGGGILVLLFASQVIAGFLEVSLCSFRSHCSGRAGHRGVLVHGAALELWHGRPRIAVPVGAAHHPPLLPRHAQRHHGAKDSSPLPNLCI